MVFLNILGRLARGVLGFLLVVLLLVPAAGRYFGTGIFWLETPTCLGGQYLGIALVLFFVAVGARRRWLIGLAAVVLLFHAASVVPWYFGQSSTEGQPLKVISFNVLHPNRQYDEVVEWVIKQDPQIVVFQEVTPPWPEMLQKLRPDFPFHYRVDELEMDVFSKLPIERPMFEKIGKMRGFIRFGTEVGGVPVVVYATHCYPQNHFGMEGFRYHQDHLTKRLPADVIKHRDRSVVVLGDLNATMWSPHYLGLVEATGLRNARKGFGICPSLGNVKNWQPWTSVAFDHCLVSEDVGVARFETGPFLGSDHLPIIANLRVSARDGAEERRE